MVRIVSDSTCDLSQELIDRYSITIVPLHIMLGDNEYCDGKDISQKDIFAWSDANKATPKTSAVSATDAEDALKELVTAGNEVIVFTISEKMSTTANVFRIAAEDIEAEDRVHVFDSASLSTGIGLLVIEAAVMAKEGRSADEIIRKTEILREKVRASFVIDTLTYLERGGRCSPVAALAGSVLKLHPKIVVQDGAMDVERKYRGSMDAVIKNYVKDLEDEMRHAKRNRAFITHTCQNRETVEAVRSYVEELGCFDEVIETYAGGVISSHCGPGTLGVLFIEE